MATTSPQIAPAIFHVIVVCLCFVSIVNAMFPSPLNSSSVTTVGLAVTLPPTSKGPPPQDACALPRDRGPCTNFSRRWHFDIDQGTCERFYYGGCGGNINNFLSLTQCRRVCVKPAGPATCFQPVVSGPCVERIRRWAFDPAVVACVPFVYGGCFGTSNRFASLPPCEKLCVGDQQKSRSRCYQPSRRVGECDQYLVRYSYVAEHDQCVPFYFSGCGGSSNNFISRKHCDSRCRLAYRRDKLRSEVALVGNMTGEDEMDFPATTEEDVCSLPRDPGDCELYAPMFYYDPITNVCYQFIYNGCHGNGNRFHTRLECGNRCIHPGAPPTSHVTQLHNLTTNRSITVTPTPPTYFDTPLSNSESESNSSNVSSNWSENEEATFVMGDSGEANDTANSTLSATQPSSLPATPTSPSPSSSTKLREKRFRGRRRCQVPPRQGPCRRYLPRFYYNAQLNECYKFIYGGCLGSPNRFWTHATCQSTCKSKG